MTTQPPEFGGCLWPVDTACFTDEWDGMDPAVQERSLGLASATLQRLTGNRVTECPVKVRPCKPSSCVGYDPYWSAFGHGGFYPYLDAGRWVNSCVHTDRCECTVLCRVTLPAPVGRVDEVKIDGLVIDPGRYMRVGNSLIALLGDDEECFFPATQDLSKPDTEPGTFSVTYLNGYPVDSNGAYAVAVLAMEYAKACSGRKCRLPSNVATITRQGVTMDLVTGAFPGGLTGIREVDAFITLWNPNALQRESSVWYPGMTSQGGLR